MAVTMTTGAADLGAILKTLYPDKRVKNLVYEDHAFLAMLAKREDFFGQNRVVLVRYANSQGRSYSFSTAQTNNGSFKASKFVITRAKDYQVCRLDSESILATQNDKGALIEALDTEVSSGLNNISKSLAVNLFRGRDGRIGSLASDPGTGTTFTLANINDVTSFEVGMSIVFAADAASALRAGGARTVSAVNRDTGVITVSAALDAALDAADLVFPEGDYASANDVNKCSGLADWLPSSAPGATAFFGVDRSVDTNRLGGMRVDISALSPEEGVVTALSRLDREGGKPSHLFVNHLDYRNVEIALGSKVVYEDLRVGEIGFQALKINGPRGPARVIADQDCPSAVGYALDMRTWTLHSLGKCPRILALDGERMDRVATADQWETRIALFAQLACDAPGWNARLTLPT